MSKEQTFSIETTLATKSYIHLVRKAHAKGYRVSLLFFWLKTPDLAIQRVAERVQHGGHHIPEDVIRRRYIAGINNLFKLFMNAVDVWNIYNNSENPRILIASGGKDEEAIIKEKDLFNLITQYVKKGN